MKIHQLFHMVKKHLGILDRDKPKEQLFNMVKMQTTHVKLQYFNRILLQNTIYFL